MDFLTDGHDKRIYANLKLWGVARGESTGYDTHNRVLKRGFIKKNQFLEYLGFRIQDFEPKCFYKNILIKKSEGIFI